MLRRLALAALIALLPQLALAQFAVIGPTQPSSDNGDRLATTAWIRSFIAAGGAATTIASGATTLGTSAISSAACATVVSPTATGTLTTDIVTASFNGDPTAITGYIPSTSGMLTIFVYPTADHVNFKVCNNTASSITPGAVTVNWRVAR